MARPSKNSAIDYSKPHDLIDGLLERAVCPEEVPFVLVRDSDKKGLRLRVTKTARKDARGKPIYGKHWQFEKRVKGKLFTRALGEWPAVSIEEARAEAHRLQDWTDKGLDPRDMERKQAEEAARLEAELKAQEEAGRLEAEQKALEEATRALTVGQAWDSYLIDRRSSWGVRHYDDHVRLAKPGGEKAKNRRDAVTIAGPLHSLMNLRLVDVTPGTVEAWATKEAKTRPTVARLAWRCLKAFLGWCSEHDTFKTLMPLQNPAKTKKARQTLGRPGVKKDALQREQLSVWFDAVRNLSSPVVAAYLQTLLLTGARPGEVLAMRWDEVNTKWKGLTIRDKVDGLRVIPLTPCVSHLLSGLPRQNEWLFSSPRTNKPLTRVDPLHVAACKVAGIDGLTLHGLRRSFKSLSEWVEVPAGVASQIMGHKPSGTVEKHYTVRPLDLLRLHHERIEAWVLDQAGIKFNPKEEPGKLRAVV